MFKDEVGIEREYFLLDSGGNIVEPALFGFPFDEFGFLVEMRTLPHTKVEPLIKELYDLTAAHQVQAERLGLRLYLIDRMKLPLSLIKHLKKKYAWDYLTDTTANIHSGVEVSHATGVDQWTDKKTIWGTAGVHVHFSRKRIIQRALRSPIIRRVQLPIEKMVLAMDAKFGTNITWSKRMMGEYEIKPYGFEYRSLPADIPIRPVVDFAFSLLKNEKKRK